MYFAIESNSMFTFDPFALCPKFVFSSVCLTNDTSNLSVSNSDIVRLIPSTVIDPFSARYGRPSFGYEIWIFVWVSSFCTD